MSGNDITLGIRLTADGKGLVGEVKLSREEIDKLVKSTSNASSEAARLNQQNKSLVASLGGIKELAQQAAAAFGLYKLAEYAKDAALLNARYETLGISMKVVGGNAGYSASQMDDAAASMQKTGISMIESRQQAMRLVQAHIDLSKATDLARIAQDAAVIGNMNSSEAFANMIHGIQTGQTDVLRTIGLNISMEQSYKLMAQQLHKNADALSQNEKTQAILNAVMLAGADIAGTYEAAMGTAGKQINSMTRYLEDVKVKQGEVFNEVLTVAVMAYTEHLKNANGELDEMAKNGQIKSWGNDLAATMVTLTNQTDNYVTVLRMMVGTLVAGLLQVKMVSTGDFSGASAVGQAWLDDMAKQAQAYDRVDRAWDDRQKAKDEKQAADLASTRAHNEQITTIMQFYTDQRVKGLMTEATYLKTVTAIQQQEFGGRPHYKDTASTAKNVDEIGKATRELQAKAMSTFLEASFIREHGEKSIGTEYFKAFAETVIGKFKKAGADGKAAFLKAARLSDSAAAEKDFELYQKQLDDEARKADNEYARQKYETVVSSAQELNDESRRLGAEMIVDDKARALALLEIEKEKWQRIIALAKEGSDEQKNVQSAYQNWLNNKLANADFTVWKKHNDEINGGLTDALMRGFEAGKGFAQNFFDSLKNMAKTLVLRPVISFILNPISGAITTALGGIGIPGMANAAGGAGGGGGGGSFGGGWLSNNWGSNVVNSKLGSMTGLSQEYMVDGIGTGQYFPTDFGASAANVMNIGGQVAGYASAFMAARDGQWGKALGTAVGTYFGGPIGSFIGSAVGGFVDDLFGGGGGDKIGASNVYRMGANGKTVADSVYSPSGGDALGAGAIAQGALNDINATAISLGGKLKDTLLQIEYELDPKGDAPGSVGFSVNGKRTAWEVNGQDVQGGAAQVKIAAQRAYLQGLQDLDIGGGIDAILESVKAASATPEEISDVIKLAGAFRQIKDLMPEFGKASIETIKALADAVGGAAALQQAVGYYHQNFYTDAERISAAQGSLSEQFKDMGINTIPATRDEFRKLAEAQDLTTEAGRKTYAELLKLAPAFISVTDASAQTAKTAWDTQLQVVQNMQGWIDQVTGFIAGIDKAIFDTQLAQASDPAAMLKSRESDLWQQLNGYQVNGPFKAEDLAHQVDLAGQIKDTILQRYQIETAAVQKLTGFAQNLGDYAHNLKIGDLSPLATIDKIAEAQAAYDRIVATLKPGSTATETDKERARSQYNSAGDALLTLQQGYYGSSQPYTDAYNRVLADTQMLGADTLTEAERQTAALQNLSGLADDTIRQLQNLKGVAQGGLDYLNGLIAPEIHKLGTIADALGSSGAIATALNSLPNALAIAVAGNMSAGTRPNAGTTPSMGVGGVSVGGTVQGRDGLRDAVVLGMANAGNIAAAMSQAAAFGYSTADMAGAWNAAHPDQQTTAQALTQYGKDNHLPGFRDGGTASSGYYIAHEGELIEGMAATRIFPSEQTSHILDRISGPAANQDALIAEVRRLREENQLTATELKRVSAILLAILDDTRTGNDDNEAGLYQLGRKLAAIEEKVA